MTYLVNKAKTFAAKAHAGLERRTGGPYVAHTTRVAEMLAAHGHDAATVAAGHLHDTLEDTPVTYADLVKTFGERVAKLVLMVTDPNPKPRVLDRAARKVIERAHYAEADYAGASVKLADMLDNMSDSHLLAKISPRYGKFVKRYRGEVREAHPMLAHGDPVLHKKLGEMLHKMGA